MTATSQHRPEASTITIITWAPLWLYWPVYVALARTEEHFRHTVRFELKPIDAEPVTDEGIRQVFHESVRRKEPAWALCEPGSHHSIASTRSDDSASEFIIVRRLPVLWRQPHWLLWRGRPGKPPTGRRVRAYPEKTTSGDFVRTAHLTIPSLRRNVPDLPLEQDIKEERRRVESLRADEDIVASFTPWHSFLNPKFKKQGERTSLLRWWTLPGPSRDVTALLVPDVVADWTRKGGHIIIDVVSRHLKVTLDEMAGTFGDPALMHTFLNDNLTLVKDFLGADDWWLRKEFLGPVLCEYVRLGCYFPYRSVESAISPELLKRLRERFDESKERALEGIQGDMKEFLGSSTEWHSLSFALRGQAWKTARPVDHGNRLLYQRLTHLTESDCQFGVANLLRSVNVNISTQQNERVSLVSLASQLPLECTVLSGDSHAGRLRSCTHHPQDGTITPSEVAGGQPPCLACVIGGVPRALLRPAALRLAKGLKNCSVSYTLAEDGRTTPLRMAMPLCVEDINGMIDVFVDEKRTPAIDQTPCSIAAYNGYTPANGGDILIAILWHGTTEAGNGTGNAQVRLNSWFKCQNELGHSVKWMGFWRRGKDYHQIQPSLTRPQDRQYPNGDRLFDRAYTDFASNGFDFAYVAVFRVEPLGPPAEVIL